MTANDYRNAVNLTSPGGTSYDELVALYFDLVNYAYELEPKDEPVKEVK